MQSAVLPPITRPHKSVTAPDTKHLAPSYVLQRTLVWTYLQQQLPHDRPARILELNCGTGADAIWLAQKGYEVLATDISAHMIETARAKTKELPVEIQNRLTFETIAAEDLNQLKVEKPFDLIFSNFGGLNCVSPNELRDLTPKLSKNLSSNGRLVFVLMSRFCWWETLYFLVKGNWTQAWRRQSKTPIEAPLAEGVTAQTWYYSPLGLSKLLKNNFSSEQQRPIGFFLPPSYLDNAFKRFFKWLGF